MMASKARARAAPSSAVSTAGPTALLDRERLVCIGRVAGTHGVHGHLKVRPLTSEPDYYQGVARVFVDSGAGLAGHRVKEWRTQGVIWLLLLDGVAGREAAQGLKGAEVLLPDDELKPLAEGEYFTDDLIGCEVFNEAGELLGRVTGLIETGANDVLELDTGHGAALVPMTEEVLKAIDTGQRRITVAPLPGLMELNE